MNFESFLFNNYEGDNIAASEDLNDFLTFVDEENDEEDELDEFLSIIDEED